MKEFIRGLVTISSTLLVIHSFLKMLNFDMFLFDLMTYAMFIVCFGLSMVSILFLIWRPMVIQLAALAFVLLIAPLIQTPVNYIGFAFTRYAIIEQLENNQLILNENKSKPGYYRAYYTRPSYMPAVNNTSIKAVVHSDENFLSILNPIVLCLISMEIPKGFYTHQLETFLLALKLILMVDLKELVNIGFFSHPTFMI